MGRAAQGSGARGAGRRAVAARGGPTTLRRGRGAHGMARYSQVSCSPSVCVLTAARAPRWRQSSGPAWRRRPPPTQHPHDRTARRCRRAALRAASGAILGFELHFRWFIAGCRGLRVEHRQVGIAARVEAPLPRQAQ